MLSENYKQVRDRIAVAAHNASRNPAAVKLVAVTKNVSIDEVYRAKELGINDFGENRVQDAADKVTRVKEVRWHFIGHLQSNKAKDVLPGYSMIHSLDRLSLARALQRCAEKHDLKARVLIQVNVSEEQSKSGLNPRDLAGFLKELQCFDCIKVCGLMTMAPDVRNVELIRSCFRKLHNLRDQQQQSGYELPELSMGMSNDYPIAVEEGATIVRIGSALFGI